MLRLRLAGRGRPRILAGHPWVYRSEVDIPAGVTPGALADLLDGRGRFIGRGYVNPRSEIVFRLLSRAREEIDSAFLDRRLGEALALPARRALLGTGDAVRLVFSEGDRLPGFTVDRYDGLLVVSIGTAGAEALRAPFLEALADRFPEDALLDRSEGAGRRREGLPDRVEWVRGRAEVPVRARFDGIEAAVDPVHGQKTGAFLDAREMRRHLRSTAAGARVLDLFAHIGLFARYAVAGGAASVTAVETDAAAAAEIRSALPAAEVVEENAFDVLRGLERGGARFDRIVLDPPAFTKDARSTAGALRGYKEVNLRALRLLAPGGLLYTSSCSYHVGREAFLDVLRAAAADVRRDVRVAASFAAAPDHPVLLAAPETDYFKGFVLEMVS